MRRSLLDAINRASERKCGRDRFHVAINMDGNGRWALARGRPREEGHVAGAAAVRRTVESAPAFGITTLTLYAFSSDNWRRPRGEVDNLMFLLQKPGLRVRQPDRQWRALQRHRTSRPDPGVPRSASRTSRSGRAAEPVSTSAVAIDYSARDALLAAAGRVAKGNVSDPRGVRAVAVARPSTPRAARVTSICSSAPAENSD